MPITGIGIEQGAGTTVALRDGGLSRLRSDSKQIEIESNSEQLEKDIEQIEKETERL